ncbi:MAG: DUF6691 family protein [Rhizobiaceae bacterium]
MINPAKVIAFLDLFGAWDPSLAFVMAGAIPVAALGYRIARRRETPLCATTFSTPASAGIDRRLVIGAVIFGIGWGLVGYCPGPALASLGFGKGPSFLFVAAMLIGMAGYNALPRGAVNRGAGA